MQVKTITVHAGRTIPHPSESYSNLRPSISMTAELEPGENPDECIRALQAKAEGLVSDHTAHLVESIREAEQIAIESRQIADLERSINRGQQQLEDLRTRANERVNGRGLMFAGAPEPNGDVPAVPYDETQF